MPISGENLKKVMRHWVSGVAIVTSIHKGIAHGLTANSFTSVSISPPLIAVTINNHTRSYQIVTDAGFLGITILSEGQEYLSELFAGHSLEKDRFSNLDVFYLITGAPMIRGGAAHLDCRVTYTYEMPDSALFIGEVVSAQITDSLKPLIYYNRGYYSL